MSKRLWLIAPSIAICLALLAGLDMFHWLRAVFGTISVDEVAASVRGLGLWAPLASILLMILQSVVVPLPGSLVAAANGVIFGVWWGTLLSWVGGLAGGSLAFWLSRILGAEFVERQVGREQFERIAALGERHGFWAVLIARLIPGLSFDLISYLAGLSRISYPRFLLATAIGMLPGTAMFTILGHDLARAGEYTWRLSLVGLLGLAGYLAGVWWYRRPRLHRAARDNPAKERQT